MKHVKVWQVGFECDHEQFWQGHGIACTNWTDCATGCGSTLREAMEDAFEMLAQQDIELTEEQEQDIQADLESQIRKPYDLDTDITIECEHPVGSPVNEPSEDCAICAGEWHYYVNLDVITE